ncbi:MAG: GDP-L-fucose synthase [Deltaproteobacteria bacterium]|nr:GDP-L-fucose synthase [Deltaproteobacteria bacterium]
MRNDQKVFVAGHTGLLGSAVAGRLIHDGWGNVVTRAHKELDLTRQADVEEFFKRERPEYVFLCAGLTGGIGVNKGFPAGFLHTNLAIQDNVFEASVKHGVHSLVFYASSCVYPKGCAQPMKESDILTGSMEETSEAYAIAKLAGLKACRAYNKQYGGNCFIALLPNSMYGPHDNFDTESSHVLAALIRKIHDAKIRRSSAVRLWGSGNPLREFVFSEDVASASVFALENAWRLDNDCYNVGSGQEASIKELAAKVAYAVGYKGEIEWDMHKPDGAARKLLDCARFNALGWRPSVSLEEGIKRTYDWFLSVHGRKEDGCLQVQPQP